MNISNPEVGKFEMNIPNPDVAQNPDAWRMFVAMRLLGLRKGEAWSPWRKTWYTGPPWIKRRYLISLGKRMIYSTSLEKWWYTGPLWGKQEILGLLGEKDDILYLLGKMMICWTPLGKNRRYLVSLGKRMIYFTSLEQWWYTGPPWGENRRYLVSLVKKWYVGPPWTKRKYLTSLVQRRKYWISFWGTHQWFYFILFSIS